MYIGLHVKYPLLLPEFNESLSLSTDYRKKPKIKFNENPSSETELLHVDRKTGGQMGRHDEANSQFSQFCGSTLNISITLVYTAAQVVSTIHTLRSF